jgi:hypothetical protein
LGKGYTPAQIQQWDEIQTFERILSTGEALGLGGGVSADTMEFMKVYDEYRDELVNHLYQISMGGNWVSPASTPGTFQQGDLGPTLGPTRNGMPVYLPEGLPFGGEGQQVLNVNYVPGPGSQP